MFIYALSPRIATLIRAAGLALVDWSILSATHRPSSHGRGLVVALLLATCTLLWLTLMTRPGRDRGITPELYALAGLGGFLIGASPNSAASAFVFVGVVAGALRAELLAAAPIAAVGALGLAISTLIYANSGVGMLAYALAFAAAALAASNSRQGIVRAEQAE